MSILFSRKCLIAFAVCCLNAAFCEKNGSANVISSIINSGAVNDYSDSGEDRVLFAEYTDDVEDEESANETTGALHKAPRDATEFMDYIEELIKSTKGKLEELLETHLPRLLRMSTSITLSPRCTYDMVRVLFGIRELKPWAIKLLDASGKLPDGILYGSFTSLGSYDECLEIKLLDSNESDADNETEISRGQYCGLNIAPFLPPRPKTVSIERAFNEAADAKGYPKEDHFSRLAPFFYFLKFRLGVCLPSTCSINDLNVITSNLSKNLRVNVSVVNCEVKQAKPWTREQIIAGSFLAAIVTLVILATIFEIIVHKMKINARSILSKCFISFSAFSNSRYLLSSKADDDAVVRPLFGIKVISIIWIILANSYVTLDLKVVSNLLKTREVHSQLLFQAVINASLAIETFFFISGLLIAFVSLKKLRLTPLWTVKNWFWFYFRRAVRLTPALMCVIAFVLFAAPLNTGPLWREIIYPAAAKCSRNWWIHFLHISNFFDVSEMCFLHLWYISADMQLFLFTPFILTLLFKKPGAGKCMILLLILASIVSTGVVTYLEQIPPTLLFANPDPFTRKAYGNKMLVKPYPHAACYLIGILVGYDLYISSEIKIKKLYSYAGWLLSVLVAISAMLISWEWNKGYLPSPIHFFFAYLVSTLLASFVLSLLFETPFIVLEKVLYKYFMKPDESKCARYFYTVNEKTPDSPIDNNNENYSASLNKKTTLFFSSSGRYSVKKASIRSAL
ncbi:Nose resistant to fluoxetine protein 6-like protein, partial [Dinothrombium tinctorium]